MNKKFIIVMNDDMEFSIILAMTDYHKNIPMPKNVCCRCGGGWWQVVESSHTLRLYGESEDFGKYEKEYALEAFKGGRIYYFDDECIEDFGIKNLLTD